MRRLFVSISTYSRVPYIPRSIRFQHSGADPPRNIKPRVRRSHPNSLPVDLPAATRENEASALEQLQPDSQTVTII
jgi:hypothetical protein